jgi:UDP-MurNAc hydroxylase
VTLRADACTVTHPAPGPIALRPFTHKEEYLREYQASVRPVLEADRARWPRHEVDVVAELTEWWTPLVAAGVHTCAGVNGRVLVAVLDDVDDPGPDDDVVAVVVDFLDRRVARWKGEECAYRFRIPRPLLERCIERRDPDWVNALFLSCRFEAERDGPYNEFVYNFFRSLSTERMAYTERYYSELAAPRDVIEMHGYVIQRHCPHLQADLTRWGSVEGHVLTCALHGWQFDLDTGACLTSDDREIYARPVDEAPPP